MVSKSGVQKKEGNPGGVEVFKYCCTQTKATHPRKSREITRPRYPEYRFWPKTWSINPKHKKVVAWVLAT